MSDCIFCQIASGKIPSKKVYEDEYLFAFRDINPVAPEHVLVIPKRHIASLDHLEEADEALAGKILLGIKKVANQLGLEESGYRVVNNIGENAGQAVFHIHFHLLGGRPFGWPPG